MEDRRVKVVVTPLTFLKKFYGFKDEGNLLIWMDSLNFTLGLGGQSFGMVELSLVFI
jgi:hypothetical protein